MNPSRDLCNRAHWEGAEVLGQPRFHVLISKAAGPGPARDAVAGCTPFRVDHFVGPALWAGVFFNSASAANLQPAGDFGKTEVEDLAVATRRHPAGLSGCSDLGGRFSCDFVFSSQARRDEVFDARISQAA